MKTRERASGEQDTFSTNGAFFALHASLGGRRETEVGCEARYPVGQAGQAQGKTTDSTVGGCTTPSRARAQAGQARMMCSSGSTKYN